MKRGAVLALAEAALFAAGGVEACSMSGPRSLSQAEVARQGAEFSRADSVYIARGRPVGVGPCGSVYGQVPAIAVKNNLPSGPVGGVDGHPFRYGADDRGEDRIVIFARRVRFSEDWLHWGQWRIIASYRIDSISHPRVLRALNRVRIPTFTDTSPPPPVHLIRP